MSPGLEHDLARHAEDYARHAEHYWLCAGQVSDHSPWFDAYKREFLRTLRFGELETLDHPVACETLRCPASLLPPLRPATLPVTGC